MEYALALAGVALANAVAILSPGPSFLMVAHTAAGRSRQTGVVAALGVGVSSLILASAALFGLSVLFTQVEWLYLAVRILGGAYLVYLGVRLWMGARTPLAFVEPERARGQDLRRAFRIGFLTQLANPKAVLFFGSVFVTLLPPELPAWMFAAVLATVFLNEFTWLLLVAVVLSAKRAQRIYAGIKTWIDRVAGGVLGLLGLRLIVDDVR